MAIGIVGEKSSSKPEGQGSVTGQGPIVVTIDGPAASGKSSVSREVARRLGWAWVSTGAFYRGLSYAATKTQTPLDDEKALVQLCSSGVWRVEMGTERTLVYFNDKDVTDDIYDESIGMVASQISQYPSVRESLLAAQRSCRDGVKGLVAEGRDCGTVVFPEAAIKIFLTASSEDRAQRRALEQGRDVQETIKAQKIRDQRDSEKPVGSMKVPDQARLLDTSQMKLPDVVEQVFEILRKELELT